MALRLYGFVGSVVSKTHLRMPVFAAFYWKLVFLYHLRAWLLAYENPHSWGR